MTSPIGATILASPTAANAESPSQRNGALREAAQEFEAVLLRQMLKSVEKCGQLGTSADSTGQNIYGSMVVDAVAEAVSRAGGLGLAKVLGSAWQMRPGPASPTAPLETDGAKRP